MSTQLTLWPQQYPEIDGTVRLGCGIPSRYPEVLHNPIPNPPHQPSRLLTLLILAISGTLFGLSDSCHSPAARTVTTLLAISIAGWALYRLTQEPTK